MQLCECQNGGECKPDTGACNCRAGFNGLHCEFPCPKGTFGINCTQLCDCTILSGKSLQYNNDQITNNNHSLTFLPYSSNGIGGSLDDISLSSSSKLEKSESIVAELIDCDPVDGECVCSPGLSGKMCDKSKKLKKNSFLIKKFRMPRRQIWSWLSWNLSLQK